MAILNQRKALAIKIESTPGTAITTASADLLWVIDPLLQPEVSMTERESLGTIGTLEAVPGTYAGKCSFKQEIYTTSSGVPAWASVILPSCGFVASGSTFNLNSNPATQHTVTIVEYLQGPTGQWVTKTLYGAQGDLKLEADDGKPMYLTCDYKGIWGGVTDSAGVGLAAFPPVPPRFAGATFTIGSYTPQISKFSFDLGATIHLQENIATVSGLQQAVITGRKCKGKIDPLMVNVATWNPWGPFLAGTSQAMSLAVPTPSGGSIVFAAPAMQFSGPQEANRDKQVVTDIDCMFNDATGDDAFSISFSSGS